MTDRLNSGTTKARIIPPSDRAERERFWIERGNNLLRNGGMSAKGEWLAPRPGLEWRCKDRHYFIAEIGR